MDIRLKIDNAKEYFSRANIIAWKKFFLLKLLRNSLIIILAVSFLFTKSDFEEIPYVFFGMGISLLIVAAISFLLLLRQRLLFFKSLDENTRQFLSDDSFVIVISDMGFLYEDITQTNNRKWTAFTKYLETKEYIFLHAASQFPLEKSLFSENELVELRKILRSNLPYK